MTRVTIRLLAMRLGPPSRIRRGLDEGEPGYVRRAAMQTCYGVVG